ncbi:AMP-binding protein [Nocardioides sp.]|uniref:AMP-binding protein n=1 Tax=Nocardioides sp. TaxID=35761 RepID=UPI002629C8C8|nr:AMP-binding protein [Nocardioides sp.]
MVNAASGSVSAADVIDAMAAWLEAPGEPDPWIVETSGSSGTPKRVRLSRRAMIASAERSAARVGGAGPWVLTLPPTYVAGLNVIARSLLAGYRPTVLDADGDLGAAIEEAAALIDGAAGAAAGGRGVFLSMVPTQLARALASDAPALARLHTVLLGGGPIDPALRSRAAEAGVRVVATYGSAETCGGCVYDGVPLDGVGLAIGTEGRVRLSGPTLAEGYEDQRLSAEHFVDGWFLTSDAGRIDADGRLVLLGRLDDMVISGGVNVPAPAVAARLRSHPAVAEVEVLGVPDEEWGNRLVAFVVPDFRVFHRRLPGSPPPSSGFATESAEPSESGEPSESSDSAALVDLVDLADLRDWVAVERPRSWAPRQLVVLDAIPLLPNGKTDRMALKARAAAESEAGAEARA